MSLVKTSLLNGIAVVVKVASALVLNKILAVYVGPPVTLLSGSFKMQFPSWSALLAEW